MTTPVITLAEAKQQLNWKPGATAQDTELQQQLTAAIGAVEGRCGPISTRSVTERCRGDADRLMVNTLPVIEVQSVTGILAGSLDTDPSVLDVDGETGVLYRIDGGVFYGPQRVTYTAGHTDTQTLADLKEAALIVLQHLWRLKRAPAVVPGQPDDEQSPPDAQDLPGRALLLMGPHLLPDGIA